MALNGQSLFLLLLMVFGLGVRHGFDLDHLATIDSITRAMKDNTQLSKFAGFLFSLGHGLVVILMGVIMNSGFVKAQSPLWMESFGHWVSIGFLLLFGLLTFWNILPHSHVLPTGFRDLLFKNIQKKTDNPLFIILVGALFAVSFDTFTQVALFSISVSYRGGVFFPTVLGLLFMLGMMTSDGLNGFFVSALIQRAEKRSSLISRSIGFIIASFSVGLALWETTCLHTT